MTLFVVGLVFFLLAFFLSQMLFPLLLSTPAKKIGWGFLLPRPAGKDLL